MIERLWWLWIFAVGWWLNSPRLNFDITPNQFLLPKLHFHFGFQSFPIFFPPFSLQNYIPLYPFSLVDIYLPLMILIWFMGLSIVFILFPAFPSRSKYSMLGCIRIIPQLISIELIWTTIILIFIRSFNSNSLSIASYRYCAQSLPSAWYIPA